MYYPQKQGKQARLNPQWYDSPECAPFTIYTEIDALSHSKELDLAASDSPSKANLTTWISAQEYLLSALKGRGKYEG